jgi:hypothetical protein
MMPRQNITKLALPYRHYRVDLDTTSRFETLEAARNEDHLRAKMLLKYADSPISPIRRRRAIQLASALSDEEPGSSMASAVCRRDQRIRLFGHLWRICDRESDDPSTFAAKSEALERPGRDLHKVDPVELGREFKADLYRAGAKDADGYLLAFLDGEYGPDRDVWKLHWHGVVDGKLKHVVDQLRNTRKYGQPRDVWMSRKPLTNLPYSLTYTDKPFWSSRWEGEVGRQAFKSRVKEPRHSELLLWLDQHSPNYFSVRIGLEVINGELVKTHKK